MTLALACGGVEPETTAGSEGEATAASSTAAASTAAEGSEGSSTTAPVPDPDGTEDPPPMPTQTAACASYVACASELSVDELEAIEPIYGAGGSCWDGDFDQAAACDTACSEELAALVMALERMGQAVPEVCDPPAYVPWADIAEILATSCVTGCHEPGGEDSSLDLSDGPYYAIYGVTSDQSPLYLVEAGSHEESYLWHKVNGSQGSVGGGGARMPKGVAALTDEQIEAIADWIDGGASMF